MLILAFLLGNHFLIENFFYQLETFDTIKIVELTKKLLHLLETIKIAELILMKKLIPINIFMAISCWIAVWIKQTVGFFMRFIRFIWFIRSFFIWIMTIFLSHHHNLCSCWSVYTFFQKHMLIIVFIYFKNRINQYYLLLVDIYNGIPSLGFPL